MPFATYASTFYRFKYFLSYLKRREPQIVADVPHRLSPGRPLPVLVIFRNADHYPAYIEQIEVFIDGQSFKTERLNLDLKDSYEEKLLHLDRSRIKDGLHKIDIAITYFIGETKKRCINDNYRGTKKEPFPCYFSSYPLPRLEGFYHGDCHSHSVFTDDQIEFGASLIAGKAMADVLGLDFFCVTDHSYDLDNFPDDFLHNDPELQNWQRFQRESAALNKLTGCLIVPGEEVSVRNGKDENVHLLVFSEKHYFPGSGDSGGHWFHFRSELGIDDVCKRAGADSVIFAAHPAEKAPALQQLLLNRGDWQTDDVCPAMTGVQVFNGHGSGHLPAAIHFWTKLLLKGRRVFALAGNDAHGNFGRNRYISLPFLKITESYNQLFGQWRTDIRLEKKPTAVSEIIKALRSGRYSLGNGPTLEICVRDRQGTVHFMGGHTEQAEHLSLTIKSSPEFGALESWTLFYGDLSAGREIILQKKKSLPPQQFETFIDYSIDVNMKPGYVRAEATSRVDQIPYFTFSNPIWIG